MATLNFLYTIRYRLVFIYISVQCWLSNKTVTLPTFNINKVKPGNLKLRVLGLSFKQLNTQIISTQYPVSIIQYLIFYTIRMIFLVMMIYLID